MKIIEWFPNKCYQCSPLGPHINRSDLFISTHKDIELVSSRTSDCMYIGKPNLYSTSYFRRVLLPFTSLLHQTIWLQSEIGNASVVTFDINSLTHQQHSVELACRLPVCQISFLIWCRHKSGVKINTNVIHNHSFDSINPFVG